MIRTHALLLAALPTLALAQGPTLTSLGANNQPTSISADGTIVVGPGFRWTSGTGVVGIGGAGGQTAISADGTTIVSDAVDPGSGNTTAAIWNGGTSWTNLGGLAGQSPCGSDLSHSYAVSGDGAVVVGLGWVTGCGGHAFRWEQATGMVDLGSTVPGNSSRANGVAASDPSVVIGWQDTSIRQGARWDGGVQSLYTFGGSPVGEALAVNPDGSVVVGSFAGNEAWRWTAGGGVQPIGVLPGFNFGGYAFDLTDDGATVVGACGFGFDRDAFLWTESGGMVKLDDHLTALGLDLTGWDLGSATAISADGRVIAGWGQGPNAFIEGWVVTLPGPVGTRYCSPAVVNSTGLPGVLDAFGSDVAADNAVVLEASDLPPNQFGYFLNGPTQGLVQPPGAAGNLCLSGQIGRHTADLFHTGASGTASLVLDLTDLPFPSGNHAIQPGETWNFTTWFRDGSTSNFTDGVSILFQ